MFHVSTMLPYTPNNKQQVSWKYRHWVSSKSAHSPQPPPPSSSPTLVPPQLLRKRHIGNDIVTIVFQEPGALPFTPKNIRSHFQHVFVVVRAHSPCSDSSSYRYVAKRWRYKNILCCMIVARWLRFKVACGEVRRSANDWNGEQKNTWAIIEYFQQEDESAWFHVRMLKASAPNWELYQLERRRWKSRV